MNFFSSDPHFYHWNIRKYCPGRPGDTVEEMTQVLIDNINKKVGISDTLYYLGDILFCNKKNIEENMEKTLGRIKCKNIFLIRGNHDYFYKKEEFSKYFQWVRSYHEVKIQDKDSPNGKWNKIILCHYPMLTWNYAHHGSWMLHGHCHGSMDVLNRETTRLDVGVDAEFSNYEPLSYYEIKAIMKAKSYKIVDHHTENTNP